MKNKNALVAFIALVVGSAVIGWAPQAPAYPAYHGASLTRYDGPPPADEAPTSIAASIRKTRSALAQNPSVGLR